MLRRVYFLLVGSAFAVLLLAGALLVTHASAATLSNVSGKLYSINLKTKQVTIATTTGRVTLHYSPNSRFLRNHAVSSVKGLVLRDSVSAEYDASSKMISQLVARGPAVTTVSGRVLRTAQRSGVVTVGVNNLLHA